MIFLQKLNIYIFLLFSIVFHEYFHALIAFLLGDEDAKKRATFNPIPHIDIWGTVLFPVLLLLSNANFLIGWAKPVMINTRYLKNPKKDIAFIAIAGPFANLILGFVFIIILKLLIIMGFINTFWYEILIFSIMLNFILFIFNLLPIPPLDGSNIILAFLSDKYTRYYLKFSVYLFVPILLLFAFGFMNNLFYNLYKLISMIF